MGVVLLGDVLTRWSDFAAFYSTSGILPAGDVSSPPPQFSVFFLFQSDAVSHGLFALTALGAFALIAGFKARVAAFLCWLLIISLDLRDPKILNGGDDLLTLLLLWGCLLPLGERWSLDAKRLPRETGVHLSPAGLGLHLQVVFLYLSAAMYKLASSSWRDGSHLQNTLERFDYVRPFGHWFGQTFPGLLPLMTWAIVGVQLVFSLVLLLPYRWWRLRLLALAAFTGLQLGMGAMLHVEIFTAVAIVAPLALIPPGFWDWAGSTWPALAPYLDAGNAESAPETRVQRVCRWARTSAGLVLVPMLVLIILNGHGAFPQLTTSLKPVVRHLNMTQNWRMFDVPQLTKSWFTVEAALSDGRKIDLLRNGEAITHDRPARYFSSVRGQRWRGFFAKHLRTEKVGVLRENYLRWEARRWQQRNPQDVVQSVDLVLLSYPLMQPVIPTTTQVLATVKL